MSARTQEWKVGAFVAATGLLLVASLFWLGASRYDAEVEERVTYFDESVQGLEVGAPVKIRGVTIGKVKNILLAPDRRLVEVHAEIEVDALQRMRVYGSPADDGEEAPTSEMRLTVSAQGITGIKFLEADFFPVSTPEVDLAFVPPSTYIPSAPSTLKSLEDAVRGLGDELPLMIRATRDLARTLEREVQAVDAAGTAEALRGLIADLRGLVDPALVEELGSDARALVRELRGTARSLEQLVGAAAGEGGSLERVTRAVEGVRADLSPVLEHVDGLLTGADLAATTASVRGAAEAATRLAGDLGVTTRDLPGVLQDLRSALRSVDRLVQLLERDPGVLLRGRTEGAGGR